MSSCPVANKFYYALYFLASRRALRIAAIIAFAALLGGFIFVTRPFAAAATQQEQPSIKFSETDFDAGQVKEGQKINHTFEFENQGNGVLRILDIASG